MTAWQSLYRDCWFANAEEYFCEIEERMSEDYDPYAYVFIDEEMSAPAHELLNFEWEE